MNAAKAKQIAAAVAWNYVKSNGAMTKRKVLGSRNVLIMRVTDAIYNSLAPSEGSPTQYRPKKDQIYNVVNGRMEFGTSVYYAKYHNKTRPVIPDNIEPWVEQGRDLGMEAVREFIFQRVL